MHHKKAILVFNKQMQLQKVSKDDPLYDIPTGDLNFLFAAVFTDFIENLNKFGGADVFIYSHDTSATKKMISQLGGHFIVRATQGHTLDESVAVAVDTAFHGGHQRVLVFFEPHPLVDKDSLFLMFSQFGMEDDCLLYGTLTGGGCYTVGMKTNHSDIFQPGYDGDRFEDSLLKRLCSCNALLIPCEELYQLNTGEHLLRLRKDLEEQIRTKPDVPHRTMEMFRILQRKYKPRQVKA